MQLDRNDVFPLSVLFLVGIGIPFGLWFGFGTHQQIARDMFSVAEDFTVVSVCLAVPIAWFALRSRWREKRLLAERGEQAPADFTAQFATESKQHAARFAFEMLRRMTATGRMPRLDREDRLSGPPLFLVPDDLAEEIEQLCQQLEICTALDPDTESALYESRTPAQLVSALAHFIEQQPAGARH